MPSHPLRRRSNDLFRMVGAAATMLLLATTIQLVAWPEGSTPEQRSNCSLVSNVGATICLVSNACATKCCNL
jgi:hypothetical protein